MNKFFNVKNIFIIICIIIALAIIAVICKSCGAK